MRIPMSDETSSELSDKSPIESKSDSKSTNQLSSKENLVNQSEVELAQESDYEKNKPVLTILYQDEYLVAIDKPAGLFVHRSFMDKDEIYFALQLVRDQIGQYVYPVHRLDKPTSGVLLFALTQDIARKMGELFSHHAEALQKDGPQKSFEAKGIQKTYYALTRGHLLGSELIDYALTVKLDKIGDKGARSDKPPQEAQTYYESIKTGTLPIALGKYDSVRYTLVKLSPMTGRKHQIRRHLAHLRHPIIGDINYGDNKQNPFFIKYFGFKRLMLMAKEISFNHPVTGELVEISAEFDQEWQQVFSQLNWSL
jgi:tRNA pseudouridine65 synthase